MTLTNDLLTKLATPKPGSHQTRLPNKLAKTNAALIAEMHNQMNFDAIFVDEGGLGAGVVDRCRMLRLQRQSWRCLP